MALPIYADLNGLKWVHNGEPFCNTAVTLHQVSFRNLGRVFLGEPFAGTTGPVGEENTEIPADPAALILSGTTESVAFHRPETMGTYALLRTLGLVFEGAPYVDISTDQGNVFVGLAVPFCGQPFVMTSILPAATVITVPAGVITVSVSAAAYIFPVQTNTVVMFATGTALDVLQIGTHIDTPSVPITMAFTYHTIGLKVVAPVWLISFIVPDYVPVMFARQSPDFGIDEYTVLALHFDGDFTDSSSHGHIPTIHNDVNMTTFTNADAPGPYGRAGEFLGNYDYVPVRDNPNCVYYPDSPDFDFFTGDFNISFWYKLKQDYDAYGQFGNWTIMAQFPRTWVPEWDMMNPNRGYFLGLGWTLDMGCGGEGATFQLKTQEYTGTLYSNARFVERILIQNVLPEDEYVYEEPYPLDVWRYVSIGRCGNQGFVSIDGVQQLVETDFSIDETGVTIDPGTVLSVGAGNPFCSIPFIGTDADSSLGLLAELIIDKGICRYTTGHAIPPYPRSTDPVTAVSLGPVLLSTVATIRMFAAMVGAVQRYECVLTGNGLAPVIVPISSFSSRQRAGSASFSEVTVPSLQEMTPIMERMDGSFAVFMRILNNSGIELQREQIFSAPLSQISISGNTFESGITFSGYLDSQVNESPQTSPIYGVNYINMSGGVRTFRTAVPNMYLRPGDFAIYDGEAIEVGTISYYMSDTGSSMELREVDY